MAEERLERARLGDLADSETTPDEGLGGRPLVAYVPSGEANRFVDARVQAIEGDEDGAAAAAFSDADPGETIRVLLLSRSTGGNRIVRPVGGYWVAP